MLVHGGFVDGSGWEGVFKHLRKNGYTVTIVQNPTISLSGDVAETRRAIAASSGPVILVGHSYGGVVITEAGNDPKVVGLVYITAFAPDKGESVAKLIANPAPGAPVPPILPPQDGFLFLDKAKFAASFAADVDAPLAEFIAQSQVPWGLNALNGEVTEASWRTKPSWYLVATDDRMIPPAAQRFMSEAGGFDCGRVAWQSCDLCVASRECRSPYRTGGDEPHKDGRKVGPEILSLRAGPPPAHSPFGYAGGIRNHAGSGVCI